MVVPYQKLNFSVLEDGVLADTAEAPADMYKTGNVSTFVCNHFALFVIGVGRDCLFPRSEVVGYLKEHLIREITEACSDSGLAARAIKNMFDRFELAAEPRRELTSQCLS
jgi:hypothetical protein